MKRKLLALALAAALAVGGAPVVHGVSLEVAAPSAVLMEAATGTVLYEKDAHTPLPPASVTKIMTLLLVMEALDAGRIGWDDTVTASEAAAAKGGSQVYLEAGEQMSLQEMLKSVVVVSANDCATALAEHVAGSEAAFVELMNRRAQELEMENTHFVNCTGLDDEPDAETHLTTAYDIALMSRALLKHDEIRDYTTIWMDSVRNGEFGLANTNKLVRFYQGTTGLKTGYTSAAGHCLSASAERDGVEFIAVVLHCATSGERFQAAKQLLDYGFANYTLAQPDPETEIPPVPVVLGTAETIVPVPDNDDPVLIEKGQAAGITTRVEVADQVRAPVEAGQRLGTLTLQSDGAPLAAIPLVAPEAVPRRTWWDVTRSLFGQLFLGA
ncbi:MAG TPA: D-alanyl-D-alanine carboxypeptidase [Candidatus Avoscillospira stercorigallinarum]|uniref:serine-type D-Ala-D-Ala carboxypeptidase n=1 Tax=Candidatus Avoscillospira stercorigallinarum TaxID=2840708 RepID=A0A9D1CNG1_9FIRM|nr:D-alanyl-D-alanine carboxypeptidase [Candidatus Avoscillospira stercorigallinarum]